MLLALAAMVGTIAFVPTSVDEHPPVLDWLAAGLSLVAVSGLVFGIIEGPVSGWSDPVVVGRARRRSVALVLFVVRELRSSAPLLDPRLFRLRGFGVGSLSLTVQFFAAFGFFFLLMQYLQFVNGFTALGAAGALLPLPFVMIPLARQAPHIADRFGFRRVGAAGLVSMAVGFLVISTLEVELSYPRLLVGLVFFAIGMALAGAPATTAIVRSLPAAQAGRGVRGQRHLARARQRARHRGAGVGAQPGLPRRRRVGGRGAAAAAERGGPGSIAFVARVPAGDPRAAAVVDAAKQAFVDGVSNAVVVAAGVLVVAAVVVALRGPGPHHEEEEKTSTACSETPPTLRFPCVSCGAQSGCLALASVWRMLNPPDRGGRQWSVRRPGCRARPPTACSP